MRKNYLFICLLALIPAGLSAQLDTLFNLNRATGHFIKGDTIWLASQSGIVKRRCSTGEVLATYTHKNAPIPYYRVDDIFVDDQHRLWIYIYEKGISMLDGDQWASFWPPETNYTVAGPYGHVAVDQAGVLWGASAYHTPMFYENGQWKEAPNPDFASFDTREMKIGPDGKMWVMNGYGGIFRHDGTQWVAVIPSSIFASDFALDYNGGFYVLSALTDGITSVYHFVAPNNGTVIGTFNTWASKIAVAPSGKVWVAGAFAEGIANYENGAWQYLNENESYPENLIHLALSVDPQGNLWDTKVFFGTKMYNGTQWQRIWNGPIGFEIGITGKDGAVWFGYLNTLSKYYPATGQTEVVLLDPTNLFEGNMVGLEAGPNGTFYAANQLGRLFWYDGNGQFKFKGGNAWNTYVRMAASQTNSLFYQGWDVFSGLIEYNAVTNYTNTIVQYHNTNPAIPFSEQYHFDLDRRDRLWMITDKGIVYWKNGAWKTFYEPGPIVDFPEGILAGVNGLWLYSGVGQRLQYFDGRDTASWYMPLNTDTNGEQIFKLYADSRNWVWCLTNRSRVLCFKGYEWEIYDAEMGTFPAFSMNSIFEDSAGDMWFLNSDDIAVRIKVPSARVSGQLFDDINLDCTIQSGEPGIGGYALVFEDGQKRIETVADNTGKFAAHIPPGDYTVTVKAFNFLGQSCLSGFPITVLPDDSLVLQIPVKTILFTPLMSVSIGTGFARRCSDITYSVNVCNDGNLAADDASVTVQMPEGLSFVGSSVSHTVTDTGLVTFHLGALDFNTCRTFSFTAKVGCEGMVDLGQSLCVTAHVFPDTLPTVGASAWTGASIVVKGQCVDNKVVFQVKNEGNTGTQAPLAYQIIQNEYLDTSGTLSLNAQAIREFELEADGSTWRFSIEQEAGHPYATAPTVAVEGCLPGSSTQERSIGFVTQAENTTGNTFESTDCQDVIGSFDPNDKNSQPKGWGERHEIKPEQPLRYTIRFQNTGTDTAFLVVIRDTLDAALDWGTFKPELSSHVYHVERDSIRRSIAFVFENIMLPDSNRNEPASHGFVQFSVSPVPQTPLGTIIRNRASIYFDFNSPVLTNTVLHTVDTGFIRPKPEPPVYKPDARIYFTPNPAGQSSWVSLEFFETEKTHRLQLYDVHGREVRSVIMPQSPFLLEKQELPAGVYQAAIRIDGKRIAVGQVVFSQ